MGRQLDLISLNNSIDATPFRFTLSNDFYGVHVLKYAPDGYLPEQFQFTRSMEHFGVFRKFTQNELKFVKDGRDYLQNCYESFGVNADVTLKVEALNPDTLTYSEKFTGTIDFSTYKINEIAVSVQVIDGMFIQKIMNREGVKVDLLKQEAIDGNYIGPVTLKMINIPALDIEQNADWILATQANIYDYHHTVPVKLVTSEFGEAVNPQYDLSGFQAALFKNSAEEYTDFHFKGTIKAELSPDDPLPNFRVSWYLDMYDNAGVYKGGVLLFEDLNELLSGETIIEATFDEIIPIKVGYHLTFRCEYLNQNTTIKYDAVFVQVTKMINQIPTRNIKGLLYHEAFERVVAQYTGQINKVYSDFFGRTDIGYAIDGTLGGVTTGRFLRKIYETNNTLSTSLKDLFKSLSIYCIGIGEVSGKLRIEPMAYWFKNDIILDLSNRIAPETIEKEVIPELLANAIKIGYNGYEYDRTGGIYEYNTLSEWSTILKLDNSFQLVSAYRADMTGILKAIAETDPTKDSSADNAIFMLDMVRDLEGDFLVRTNEGLDYATGGADTEQNFNLLLTPARTLRRWGAYIRAMLDRWQLSYIRWQASEKSTTLRTLVTGETEVSESADIQVKDLDAPLWHPEKYIVKAYVTRDELASVTANPLGIVKLADDKFGWILDFKVQNHDFEVELSLLRVNLQYVTPVMPEPPTPPLTEINYGLLYNWWAATDARGITSSNQFRLPTKPDAETLLAYNGELMGEYYSLAGGKLKETGLIYWNDPNTGANNESGFNARGAGARNTYNDGAFNALKAQGFFYTSLIEFTNYPTSFYVNTGSSNAYLGRHGKRNMGYSIRLVRPATETEQELADGTPCDNYTGNDGKIYRTVKIGTQVWLADNLAETKYRNGDWIHGFDGGVYTPISNEDWAALTTAACCAYDDDTSNI